LWFNRTSGTSDSNILTNSIASNNRIAIRHVSNVVSVGLWNGSTYIKASEATVNGTWYHLAATWDGSATLAVYLNTAVASGTTNPNSSSVAHFALGVQSSLNTSYCFPGLVEDVRIADEVWDDWKIQAQYNFGKGSAEAQPHQRLIQPTIKRTLIPIAGV